MKVQKLDRALAPRTSLRLKVTQIGTAMGFFSLITLAFSGSEEAVILVWCCLERTSQFYVCISLIVVRKYSGLCTGTQVTNVSPSSLSFGGIPEG